MNHENSIGSSGSGGFVVVPDQPVTMADVIAHERNLKEAEDDKDIKRI